MRKLVPIGRLFNLDRGTPIHNFYCNQFLSAVAGDIRGRVLHVGEPRERGRAGASVSSFLNTLGLSETEALSLEEVREQEAGGGPVRLHPGVGLPGVCLKSGCSARFVETPGEAGRCSSGDFAGLAERTSTGWH